MKKYVLIPLPENVSLIFSYFWDSIGTVQRNSCRATEAEVDYRDVLEEQELKFLNSVFEFGLLALSYE